MLRILLVLINNILEKNLQIYHASQVNPAISPSKQLLQQQNAAALIVILCILPNTQTIPNHRAEKNEYSEKWAKLPLNNRHSENEKKPGVFWN